MKQLRLERKWTQEEAAERCNLAAKVYQFYELGVKNNPTLATIEKISKGFEVTLAEFFEE